MADIGKNIRLLRLQKGMTQDELAEKLFVSRQTISNYETGRSQPDIDMLLRIAEILDTEAQTILYGTPDTTAQLAAKKRAIAASFTLVGLAIVYHLLKELRDLFLPRFMLGGLSYFLVLLLRPALFLWAGWTVMQLLSVLTKARPLRSRWAKCIFRSVLILLVVYSILLVPVCGSMLWSDLEIWKLYVSGSAYNYSRTFSITPGWDNAVHWISSHIKGLTWCFPLAGIALWLTGDTPKATQMAENAELPTDIP